MAQSYQNNKEPTAGEWLDVQEEALYVPDKHYTTYHTSQTCSICGVRTRFVGQKPYINDAYCPYCGTQMTLEWTFHHCPLSTEMHLTGYQHDAAPKVSGDLPISLIPFAPKNIEPIE